MAHQVFISYTQPDKNAAFTLHDALFANGISAWVANSIPDGVISGNPYKAEIVKAVEGCIFFILLYSDFVNGSNAVKNELALAEGKVIIPVRLDYSPMCSELKHDLHRMEYIDATDKNMTIAARRLIHDIRLHLSNFKPTETLSTDKILLRKGIQFFRNQLYDEAKKILLQYNEIMPADASGRFYLALCLTKGRRPEKLDGLLVQQIEALLLPFADKHGNEHINWLLAFVKYGYYQMNNIREKPPNWVTLLTNTMPDQKCAVAITTCVVDVNNRVWQMLHQLVKS